MRRYQLSLPGPSEVDPRVIQSLTRPNLPHYGELWMGIYAGILEKLRAVYRTSGRVFVLPSSGSGAIDAAFSSVGDKRVLILNNGNFGARLAEIGSHHFSYQRTIDVENGVEFSPEAVETMLRREHFDLLAMVHGETSTGMLNRLEPFAELCREQGTLFFVDAISTLGGVPLDMETLGIDFCVSATQKALGSLPGLASLAVSDRGFRALPEEEQIPSWYFNLRTWDRFAEEWGDWHPYPMTLPVHLFFAFDTALDLLLEEGLERRWTRHDEIRRCLEVQLLDAGITPFVREQSNRLATVTAATLPEGYVSADLLAYLREEHGILVAGGVGPLRKRIFRVGHMGYSAQEWMVNRVAAGIRSFLDTEKR